jgi:hypothetical protein
MVDRIHVIQKVLDQSGVSEAAEVSIPEGAQLLTLRTVKPDGTVLEPESIAGKDGVSLPNVQVGDYVEHEFLQAHAPRGPLQPGFTAASFYFQIARTPNHWSTYTVVAPKAMGLTVDAHNMKAPAPEAKGDTVVFTHTERKVPPFIPEPDAPPSPNETLPFVSVGAGAQGNESIVTAYADAFLDNAQLTYDVERFAKDAAQGKTGLEAVRAVYSAVMKRLSGRDAGLGLSATASLAQDRGSRLWTLKAALEALGIPARVVAVRTFAVDPAPYRFPNEQLLPYMCLRVTTKEGEAWLDPLVRFAPFGVLPEQAMGGREAWVLPEPGRPLEQTRTPPAPPAAGKTVTLKLQLALDGTLTGEGEELYLGFEAAQLAEALEALAPDQRNQALEGALSRYYGGAEMSGVTVDFAREVGAPLTVRYRFKAPHFARLEPDGDLVLSALTFPAQLGARFVQLGSRTTPLYIDSTEASRSLVELTLPPGYQVLSPAAQVKSQSAYGHFRRAEKQEGNVFHVEEEYRLGLARIPPKGYEELGQFAGEVDLVQSRDLVVRRVSPTPAAPKK